MTVAGEDGWSVFASVSSKTERRYAADFREMNVNVAVPFASVVAGIGAGVGAVPAVLANSSFTDFEAAGWPCPSVRVTVTTGWDVPSEGTEAGLTAIATLVAAGPNVTTAVCAIATPSVRSVALK